MESGGLAPPSTLNVLKRANAARPVLNGRRSSQEKSHDSRRYEGDRGGG